ncbi:MAG TPA: urease accessory protein UreD [Actinomycetaceae bacterium]|nr:urease accessory protein UreD [Actinomycetaceae bacterium]
MTMTLGFSKAAPSEVAGALDLTVQRSGVRTRPVKTEGSGVLRLMHPLYLDDSGQLTYIVVNPGGAYFGEDYRMRVEVGEGASLLLASQGATRIYKTPHRPAVHDATFTLAAGSRLEYVPEQIIAYRDANYRQTTLIEAHPEAQAFMGEIVTPGWDPDDARFTYAGMRLRVGVRSAGGAVCLDNVSIRPAHLGKAINGLGYLEGASHMGSTLMVGPHAAGAFVDQVRDAVDAHGLNRAGVTAGVRHGVSWVMVRALADSTDALRALILDVNEVDRSATTGQGHLDLRRY